MSSTSTAPRRRASACVKIAVMPSDSAFDERDRPDFSRWSQDGSERASAASATSACFGRRFVAPAEDSAEQSLLVGHG